MSQHSFHQATESGHPQSPQPPAQLIPPPPIPAIPPTGRPRRKKLRLVLIIVGALLGSLVGYSLVTQGARTGGAVPSTSERPTATLAPGEIQSLSVLDLQDGDCYIQKELPPPDGSTLPISSVELTACTTQHNAQVIAKLPYKAADNFKEIRETQAGPDCGKQYRLKVQPTILADSAYQSVILSPRDQDSWNRQPFVACVLVTETPTVGSTFIS